jgi:hypothetical protein
MFNRYSLAAHTTAKASIRIEIKHIQRRKAPASPKVTLVHLPELQDNCSRSMDAVFKTAQA